MGTEPNWVAWPKGWTLRFNGGVQCDALVGPCACGATHVDDGCTCFANDVTEYCVLHHCKKHEGEELPCWACEFNEGQRVMGAGYRSAKAWKACAKKWRSIVKQVDAECMAAHEAEISAKRRLTYYSGWDERMADLESVKDAAQALMTLHDDPDPAKREAGKRALWDELRRVLGRV